MAKLPSLFRPTPPLSSSQHSWRRGTMRRMSARSRATPSKSPSCSVPQAEFDKCWNPCKAGLDELMKEHAGEFLQAEPEDDNATVEPHNNATVAPHNNDNATVAPHNNDDAAVPLPTNATAVVEPAPLAKGDDEENECPASCEPLKKPVMQCAVGCKDDDDKHQCVHNCMLNEKKSAAGGVRQVLESLQSR